MPMFCIPIGALFSYFEYTGDDFEGDMVTMHRIQSFRNGGRSVCPAMSHSPIVVKENGGPPWKKSSIRINRVTI